MAGAGACQRASVAQRPAAPDPAVYQRMCAAALVAAKEFGRLLRSSSALDAPPTILDAGPPVRIRCQIHSAEGVDGTVTADIRCLDAFDRTCVTPVRARLGGVVVQGPGRVPTS